MEMLKTAADQFAEVVSGNGSGVNYGFTFNDGSSISFSSNPGDGCGAGWSFNFDNGSGHGSGDGLGCDGGYGNGSGYGYGVGYGYGYGIASFCGQKVYRIDDVLTFIDLVHGNIAKGRILRGDFSTEVCYIVKQDGLFAHGETLHKAMDALRDKLFEDMPEEERIAEFVKAHEWGKQYPSADYYNWHYRLTGSCDMGRSEFAERHGYKLTDDELLTVEEFIKLTENSYGSSVIRKLREAYKS